MLWLVRHLVAAPDKFRGSATARQVAGAAAIGARHAGFSVDVVPMADGGEGLLDAVGGTQVHDEVEGPLRGQRVEATWCLLEGQPKTAVIEMSQAAGLSLAGGPTTNDPVAATTAGVGELILDALGAGVERIVVGCGGSATTDGGAGAIGVLGDPAHLEGVDLLIACDVTTTFEEAATVFAPQKGADHEQVEALTERLSALTEDYRRRFGVDVRAVPGGGAAGGLAGGLHAMGGRLVPGFDLVATLVGLEHKLAAADAVMTGEGLLDATSFHGKVVGGVSDRTPGGTPILCVVGEARVGFPPEVTALHEVVLRPLVPLVGVSRAHAEVLDLVAGIVGGELPGMAAG